MKTRVAFGVTGAVVVILALFVFPPIVAQLLMMALSVCAAQEFTAACGCANLPKRASETMACTFPRKRTARIGQ